VFQNHYSDSYNFDDNGDGYGDFPYYTNGSYRAKDLQPIFVDPDHDNIDSFNEVEYGTNISNPDTDYDGLTDYEEIFLLRAFQANSSQYTFALMSTNPLNPDSDNDGLNDFYEMKQYYTNPNNPDTDNDGFSDLTEINSKSNPRNPSDWPGKGNQNTTIQNQTETNTVPVPDRSILAIPGYSYEVILVAFFGVSIALWIHIQKKLKLNFLMGGKKYE
jgi:hypothetical protein